MSKENIIIKISEFDTYEISANGGNTFERVESSTVFSADQREEFRRNFSKFNGCDYRDKELYDPTVKLVEMIQNTRQLFYELSSCFVLKY